MILRLATCLLVLICYSGCQNTTLDFKSIIDFEAYLNNPANGYIGETSKDGLVFEARLIPVSNLSPDQLTIQVRISREDEKSVLRSGDVSEKDALDREGYLSFDLGGDVWIESGESKIPTVFHHYERNYNIKPSIDILFRFNSFTPKEDVFLVYEDKVFGTGLIKIEFDKNLFTRHHVKE